MNWQKYQEQNVENLHKHVLIEGIELTEELIAYHYIHIHITFHITFLITFLKDVLQTVKIDKIVYYIILYFNSKLYIKYNRLTLH